MDEEGGFHKWGTWVFLILDDAYVAPMWQNVSYFYQYFSMCIFFKYYILIKNPFGKLLKKFPPPPIWRVVNEISFSPFHFFKKDICFTRCPHIVIAFILATNQTSFLICTF